MPAAIPEPPNRGYLQLLSIFATSTAGFSAWFARSGRELPERIDADDLALLTLASHKLARIIAKDRVLRPLRQPFTELEGDAGPGEVSERPRPDTVGLRHAVGDLLVCPYCLGMWTSSAFMGGLLVAPRTTRAVASVFATYLGSELLQVAYKRSQDLI